MKTFAEHFCLKDGRDNFFIDETRDSQLVLGSRKYKKTVDEMLDAAIASRRPPRLGWVGDFGVARPTTLTTPTTRFLGKNSRSRLFAWSCLMLSTTRILIFSLNAC